MTKKHFEFMADYIASHGPTTTRENALFISGMYNMAVACGNEFSPRFDRDRFRKACGEAYETAMHIMSTTVPEPTLHLK